MEATGDRVIMSEGLFINPDNLYLLSPAISMTFFWIDEEFIAIPLRKFLQSADDQLPEDNSVPLGYLLLIFCKNK